MTSQDLWVCGQSQDLSSGLSDNSLYTLALHSSSLKMVGIVEFKLLILQMGILRSRHFDVTCSELLHQTQKIILGIFINPIINNNVSFTNKVLSYP